MRKRRALQILVGCAVVCLVAALGLSAIRYAFPGVAMQRVARSLVGKSESEVLRALGSPKHVVLADELKGRTVNFPWKGMNFVPIPNRPVHNKVLLYSDVKWAAYLYIDEKGMVEHVATAAT